MLIILLCATARSLWADDGISIGTLVLDWPEGFSNQRTGDALLLRGPDDEQVVVSYLRGRNDFGRLERARFARMHQVFALRTLPDSAAMRGAVVQALRCTRLPNGTVIYSTASQASQASQPYYYLQYFVVGPFSASLFKIEGYGDAIRQKSRFDAVFASAYWNEVSVTGRIH